MGHTPPSPDEDGIDRLIDGAMQEVAELSWDTRGASGSRTPDEPSQTIVPPVADAFPSFQVLKEIRSGGQAVVYLGVEDATDRRVAIKAFRPSTIATPKDRYRFEREIEALQDLVHPNIVRILHADASGTSPFIVMEYVPGWNLDEYFREHDLDVRATMRLFRTITLAIHAAHQKGVIHRDIKPTNIRIDHNAEPHVLDFGLAKLPFSTTPEPTMTETGQFLGTLHWVSPEQAEGRVQDVDVRTDVYSLGMVLYHMLTGQLPFETGGSMRDVLNRIAAAEPVPPSKHRREIDDDVETIVLKCLAKEPSRRYASAAALGEDVGLWLEGRAILAKRDSAAYVVRKFIKRHRGTVGVSVAFMALIVSATVLSGMLWQRAEREAKTARQERDNTESVTDVLMETLTSVEEATSTSDRKVLKRMMDEATRRLDKLDRSIAPEADLRRRHKIGNVYFFVGEYELAREQFAAGVELARKLHGPDHPEVAWAMRLVGEALHWNGKAYEALPWHQKALAIVRQHPETPDTTKVEVLAKLAVCLVRMERPQEALAYAEEALGICRARGWNDRLVTARTLTIIGHAQADLDRTEQSLTAYNEVLAMCLRTRLGRQSGEDLLAQTEGNVGKALMAQNRYQDARTLLQQGLDRWRMVYPEDHPYLVPARRLLASCFQALGQHENSVALYETALAECRKLNPEPHPATAAYLASLADALRSAGRPTDGVAFAIEGSGMARSQTKWDPLVRVSCEWALARAQAAAGMIEDAVATASQYQADGGSSKAADAPGVLRHAILAELLLIRSGPGDAQRSESLARDGVELCRYAITQGRAPTYLELHVTGLVGAALAAQDRFDEAQPLLLNARTALTDAMRTRAQLHVGVDLQREAEDRLVWFYDRWNASQPGNGFDLEAARWRAALQR